MTPPTPLSPNQYNEGELEDDGDEEDFVLRRNYMEEAHRQIAKDEILHPQLA